MHTPGPWDLMAGMPTNVLGHNGMRVARCDFDGDFDAPEAHANARLIAAAPDMLRELQLLNLDENGEQKPNTPAARIIARATGSES